MAKYRMIEHEDPLTGRSWTIQKKVLWWWTEHFGPHIFGATFFDKSMADIWWEVHTNPFSSKESILKTNE